MVDKKNIIDAWIMIEHLSEGDIKDNDKAIFKLESPRKMTFTPIFRVISRTTKFVTILIIKIVG